MRVLAVIQEAYGGFGGIAVYNRDLLNALASLPYIESIDVMPRAIRETPTNVPEKCHIKYGSEKGLLSYFGQALKSSASKGYDLILCTHINLLPFARLAAGLSGAPIGCVIYGTDAWKPSRRKSSNYLVKNCDLVISISDVTAERFADWSGVPVNDIKLLPNALHAADFGIADKSPVLLERYGIARRKVILTFGRLDAGQRQKGFDELIDVMPSILEKDPNIVCLVCGGGDDLPRLQEKVKASGLESDVIFTGRVDENEKADHYRLADVFTLIGRQEGFGFVFLEALACGVPVVGSQIDGSRYALLEGQLGLLAHPDKPDTMRNAIFECLKTPKSIPADLSYFSYENFVARLNSIMKSFMAQQKKASD